LALNKPAVKKARINPRPKVGKKSRDMPRAIPFAMLLGVSFVLLDFK